MISGLCVEASQLCQWWAQVSVLDLQLQKAIEFSTDSYYHSLPVLSLALFVTKILFL